MTSPYILWLGSIYDVEQAASSYAAAPAAGRWQTSLLTALSDAGTVVRAVGHWPEQLWPRGRTLYVKGHEGIGRVSYRHVPYVNAPLLRPWSLERHYLRAVAATVAEHGPPRAVLSYNIASWMRSSVQWLKNRHDCPWIPIVLDFLTPEQSEPAAAIRAEGREAAAYVFLSHWATSLPLGVPSLYLDSGVDGIWDYAARPRAGDMPTVVYTGMLSSYGGVDRLARAVLARNQDPVRLVITGRGPSAELQSLISTDSRICYEGLVPEMRLNEIIRDAAVLANPRPHDVPGNEWNFPSKLLHYLSTLRPVASTITPGVAPEYRDHVAVMHDTSREAINSAIDRCLGMSADEDRRRAQATADFLATHKTWPHQASRLLAFVDEVCSMSESRGGVLTN